ncbi:MAG: nucleotidyltransferase domain-containing protein [Candidatus Bipolaricaulota bacterium]|nr:nucleotidyltransferase domain-containing protein [Candidatus Bipolaricaulota bacterium]
MTVYSLDREAVEAALAQWVKELAARPEVEAVVLFGSFASGRAVPGSDLDLLIVLREDPRPFLDRLPDYMPDDLPLPVDVFPYTRAELEAGQPLGEDALRTGRVLWVRGGSAWPGRLSLASP